MNYYKYLTRENKERKKQILEKECSKFFKVIKKKSYFYRGIDGLSTDFKKIKSRKDRKPRDTPFYVHKRIDEMFKKYFGWYVRSEGIFTSPDSDDLEDYGDIYIFVPVGDFQYIWSREVKDLYTELLNIKAVSERKISSEKLIKNTFEKRADIIEDIIKKYHYNKGLNLSTKYKNEVIFKCDYYYVLNTTSENYEIYDELSSK